MDRRWTVLVVVEWLVLALAGGALAAAPIAPKAATGNQAKVALVLKALSNSFFATVRSGAESYALAQKVQLEVFGIERSNDVDHQASIIRDLISRNYGAIVLAPADSVKLVPLVREASGRGIVVINIDNPLDSTELAHYGLTIPFVGADNHVGGKMVGAYIRGKLKGKGKVLVIKGTAGTRNAELRKNGYVAGVTEGGGVAVVEVDSGSGHSDDAFSAVLKIWPSGPFDAVLCHNDTLAMGALRALDLLDVTGKVLIGSYDNTEGARVELRNGRMHATLEQHAEMMGQVGVELAMAAMHGQKLPASRPVPLDLITTNLFGRKVALMLPADAVMAASLHKTGDLFGLELLWPPSSPQGKTGWQEQLATWAKDHVEVIVVETGPEQQAMLAAARSAGMALVAVDRVKLPLHPAPATGDRNTNNASGRGREIILQAVKMLPDQKQPSIVDVGP